MKALDTLAEIKGIFNKPSYWDGTGNGYKDSGYSDFPVNAFKARYVASEFGGPVLDVGCAYGYMVQQLRSLGLDAWGIDVSDYAISQASEDVKAYLSVGYGHQLPFQDNHFKTITCFGMLEHIPAYLLETTLKEFKRVADTGILAVTFSSNPHATDDLSHTCLQSFREWARLTPPGYILWEDDEIVWFNLSTNLITLVAPTIYPVGGDGYGGIERLVSLFARGLHQQGARVRCICTRGSLLPVGVDRAVTGPPIIDFHEPGLMPTLKSVKGISRCFVDFSHSKPVGSLSPSESCISLIWHDPYMMKCAEPRYNVAALSEWQATRFREVYGQDCRVVDPICADGDYFIPGTQKQDYLVWMGILSPNKGALEAITACKKLRQKLKVLGKATPGDPPEYVDAVKRECDGVDIEDLGEVSMAQKRMILQEAKAMIYPVSYPDGLGEAHSHKGIESMLCGTPLVVYDQGAMREVVDEGVTGFVVPGRQGLETAIRNCESLDAGKCREKAMERWDYRATIRRWLPVIDEVSRGARW